MKLLVSVKNIPVAVLKLVGFQLHLEYGGGKDGSFNTATGIFPPETKSFNSDIMEIVALLPRNNNPKISDYFWSNSISFLCSDHELHQKYP